ncbi:hypothetical protein [Haloarcula onubensis]|uniref:DNA-binding protein n=1 Tax=Haloarcula onubensis TaxID=2950539 RepID=A0ABU2FNF9_9EURY|nr:hypothetical protein [Halomicroarcula sp. S3CR25-11]MDS0282298.1 hypothetical protein [Halomicroarcula sp. S3CR25-11]
MTQWQRAVIALLVLSALGGLFVHEDATSEARTPYPEPHELAADYDSYVGEEILVFGRVSAVDGSAVVVEAESEGVTIELRVTGASVGVETGGVLQVYGELGPDREMAAQRVVVVNDSGGAEWYKYGVSAVGALGFLVAFLWQWRLDRETWTLEARDG